jgi:tetratricopeptide (TPR) repeat protein/transcriptional regulator with XRE-family HTH domain
MPGATVKEARMDGADESAGTPVDGASVPGRPGEECPPATSLAAKIDRLFRTTHPPGSTGEYTYEQVAAAIAERGGPTISASYLYLLRRGLRDNPTKRHLEALAGFFGVPAGYFLDTADPAEAERLRLLSALRDPRVHALALTAAALPDAELDVVTQLVTLAGDLKGIRGAAARRRGSGSETAGGEGTGDGLLMPPDVPSQGERDRAAELELSYARMNLQDGQAAEALRRLSALGETRGIGSRQRDEAAWLTAHAYQALGRPEQALTILQEKLDDCLDGTCDLPLAEVGEEVCQLSLDAGDRVMAVHAGNRTLAGLEERGLGGTGDHLRLAATVMDAHLGLGQLLHASALAQQILSLAENLGDPQRQAWTYLRCARVAESRGRLEEAIQLSNRALTLAGTPGAAEGPTLEVPRLRLAAASCLLRTARPEGDDPGEAAPSGADAVAEAVGALEAARQTIGEQGTAVDRGRWAGQRAVADLVLGEPVAAEVNARRALAQLSGLAHPATVEAHLVLGDALRAQGRHAHADAAHEQAGRVLAGLSPDRWGQWTAGVWRSLGERWRNRGSAEQAAEAYRRALDAAHLSASRPEPGPVSGSRRR